MPNYIHLRKAVTRLPDLNRIIVIGCSGGGKTTLSRKLAKAFDLDYLSLDRDVRWLSGWKERERSEQRAIITQLVKRDRWVFDGSGASTFDLRLPRAEIILWVRVPRYVALFGLTRRVMKNFGKVRPHMSVGCPEKLPDREFLSYIWNFEKNYAPGFVKNINQFGPNIPTVVLRSHGEMAEIFGEKFNLQRSN